MPCIMFSIIFFKTFSQNLYSHCKEKLNNSKTPTLLEYFINILEYNFIFWKYLTMQWKHIHTFKFTVFSRTSNFRAEPLHEQTVAQNYYFFAHYSARKLNVHKIFLLKRGTNIRLRETGKRVKHIFFALIKLFFKGTVR